MPFFIKQPSAVPSRGLEHNTSTGTCNPRGRAELQQLLFPLLLQVLSHNNRSAQLFIFIIMQAFLPPSELLLLLQLADFVVGVVAFLQLYL